MPTHIYKHIIIIYVLLVCSGCMLIQAENDSTSEQDQPQSQTGAKPSNFLDWQNETYSCTKNVYDVRLEERLAARSTKVQMIGDSEVEIELWSYRPIREAIAQGIPIPTTPPDGYDREYLPTDYQIVHYDLMTNTYTFVPQNFEPFRNDYCHGTCEQQVLSNSPDNQWQLVLVPTAKNQAVRGAWLVHRDYYQQLIAPFDLQADYYRTSEIWWRWQEDSTGLYLNYRTAGERGFRPLFIRLTMPPAYAFLQEGINFSIGGFSMVDSIAINDQTILARGYGSINRSDGQIVQKQWSIYEPPTGNQREATDSDFLLNAKYLLTDDENAPLLVRWSEKLQEQWLSNHPEQDIWNMLGDQALYAEPYTASNGVIKIPRMPNEDSLEIIECSGR